MYYDTERLRDSLLDTTLSRAIYAKKDINHNGRKFALLFLNAHFRPVACVTFNNAEELSEEIAGRIAPAYHTGGMTLLFKYAEDNTVTRRERDTETAIAVHAILAKYKTDVHDVIYVGNKIYFSSAMDKTYEFADKERHYIAITVCGEHNCQDFKDAHTGESHSSDEWLELAKNFGGNNGCGVYANINKFETEEARDAYCHGVEDADDYFSSDFYTVTTISSGITNSAENL